MSIHSGRAVWRINSGILSRQGEQCRCPISAGRQPQLRQYPSLYLRFLRGRFRTAPGRIVGLIVGMAAGVWNIWIKLDRARCHEMIPGFSVVSNISKSDDFAMRYNPSALVRRQTWA